MSTTVSTRDRVHQLKGQGLTVREIASILNVSTQAVYKHLKALEADGDARRNGKPAA